MRRFTAVQFAMLFVLAGTLGGVEPAAAQVDEQRLADEIRFRHDFGLRADEAYVRELMADPSAYGRWDYALTEAEAAEMDRRYAMEGQMDPLERAAEGLPAFAGHWIDQRAGGIITVAFTQNAASHRALLEALVPTGAQLRLVEVRYALADLEAVEDRITKDRDRLLADGVEVSFWGTDISENRVAVGVIDLTARKEQVLQTRYGDMILAVAADPVPTACTSKEACFGPPLRGGVSAAPANVVFRERCSIAFLVHSGSNVQWLTAGHCAQVLGVPWFQGANPNWGIGSIQATCWPQCDFSDAARGGSIPNVLASDKVWLNYLGDMRNISASQGVNDDDEGDMTCLNARRSEASARCGTMQFVGNWTYQGGVFYRDFRFATYAHKYGDSGGAVQSPVTPNFTYVAYGVHSGCTLPLDANDNCTGLSMYSHVSLVGQELGVTVCTSVQPCTAPDHDFTSDRKSDLLAINDVTGDLWLFRGNGAGNFSSSNVVGGGWQPYNQIAAGDFTSDGNADLLAINDDTGDLRLYRGNGAGGFPSSNFVGGGWQPYNAITAGDFNTNGKPDLLAINDDTGELWLFRGDGAGGFPSASVVGTGWQPYNAIAAGDFTSDGNTDLFAINDVTGELWLYRGNSAGGFSSWNLVGGGWQPYNQITAGDFTSDGKADLLAINDVTGELWLYRGNGAGGFSSWNVVGPGWQPYNTIT